MIQSKINWRTRFSLIAYCSIFAGTLIVPQSLHAAVTITRFVPNLGFIPRAANADTGIITLTGSASGYASLLYRVMRNGVAQSEKTIILGTNGAFTSTIVIKAECALYKVEILGINGQNKTVIASADSVVCGDLFLVTGQSNAVASASGSSAASNESVYLRTFGLTHIRNTDTLWRLANADSGEGYPGHIGQWEAKMGRLIIDTYKVPVAIINCAEGNKSLAYFTKDDLLSGGESSTYMKWRVTHSGCLPFIKTILFNQGEADGGNGGYGAVSLADYKNTFATLLGEWKADYPALTRVYMFQSTPDTACAKMGTMGPIKEAQRQIAETTPMVSIMSTSAADHTDPCHYGYTRGYEFFGNDIFRLVARDFYKAPALSDIEPPSLKTAYFSGPKQITLVMKNATDKLTWKQGSEKSFVFTGKDAHVTAGAVTNNAVVLTLDSTTTGLTAISYTGLAFPSPDSGKGCFADPLVTNKNGVGALHFDKFPLSTSTLRPHTAVHNGAIFYQHRARMLLGSFSGRRGLSCVHIKTVGQSVAIIDIAGRRIKVR